LQAYHIVFIFQIKTEDLHVSKKKKATKDYVTYPPRIVFKVLQTESTNTILKHTLQVEGLSSIRAFKIVLQPHSTTRSPPDDTTASGSSSVAESFSSCSSSALSGQERGKTVAWTS